MECYTAKKNEPLYLFMNNVDDLTDIMLSKKE